jgi:hypothetical protein
MSQKSKQEEALKDIDESKRRTLVRLGLGAAFVTPVVASFSMSGLTISKVHAASRDGSGLVEPSNTTKDKDDSEGPSSAPLSSPSQPQ